MKIKGKRQTSIKTLKSKDSLKLHEFVERQRYYKNSTKSQIVNQFIKLLRVIPCSQFHKNVSDDMGKSFPHEVNNYGESTYPHGEISPVYGEKKTLPATFSL